MEPNETVRRFDAFLLQQGLSLDAVVIGGTALGLLRSKLFALCDRGTDLPDCIALTPSMPELAEIVPWLEEQDAHRGWPDHVRATFEDLRGRLADGV